MLNPTFQQLAYSDMELVVAGSADSINMVEGGALEVSEEDVVEALTVAQKGIRELIAAQEELLKQIGSERPAKMEWTKAAVADDAPRQGARRSPNGKIKDALNQKDKHGRIDAVERVKKEIADAARSSTSPTTARTSSRSSATSSTTSFARRCSRPGTASTAASRTKFVRSRSTPALLPRAHGSALFTRGQTQALVAATLGTANDVQRLETDQRAGGDDEVVHAALQLPAVLDRRSAPDARHVASRDRPRQPGRARAAGRAAGVRGVPVHDSHRLRRPRVERLVVDGVGVRRLARAVRRRRADSLRRRRRRDGPHQGREEVRDPHRHPRHRGSPRRHGLQGRRHEARASRRSRWTSRSRASI